MPRRYRAVQRAAQVRPAKTELESLRSEEQTGSFWGKILRRFLRGRSGLDQLSQIVLHVVETERPHALGYDDAITARACLQRRSPRTGRRVSPVTGLRARSSSRPGFWVFRSIEFVGTGR